MTPTIWKRLVIVSGILAQHSLAQSSVPAICSDTATSTVTRSADATAIASACPTYYGSLAIGGPNAMEDIYLDGLETVIGDFNISPVTSPLRFSTTADLNITGNVVANGAITANTIGIGTVGGSYLENNCLWGTNYYGPASGDHAQSLSGEAGITGGNRVSVYFNLTGAAATEQIVIQLAQNLSQIDIIGSFNGLLAISQNYLLPTVNLDVNIDSLTDLDVSNVSSFVANGLYTVSSFNISGSTINTLDLQDLTSTADFKLKDNVLGALDLPKLDTISGDLTFINNTISDLTGFTALTTVLGNVNIDGSLYSVDFPHLRSIGGDMTLTTDHDLSCSDLASTYAASGHRIVNGTFSCTSGNSTVTSAKGQSVTSSTNGNVTTTPISSANSGNSSSVSSPLGINLGIGLGISLSIAAIVAGIVFYCLRRRKLAALSAAGEKTASEDIEGVAFGKAELPSDTSYQPHYELSDSNAVVPGRYEMLDRSGQAHELQAPHGTVEVMSKPDPAVYVGELVGSEWRYEAPGDNVWAQNNRPTSFAASGTARTATAQPISPTSQQQSPKLVSVASPSLKSPVSPDHATSTTPSSAISPVSAGRLSHTREVSNPMVPPKEIPAKQASQVLAGRPPASEASLCLPQEESHQLEHRPSVSSLAPSEGSVKADEQTSLLAKQDAHPHDEP